MLEQRVYIGPQQFFVVFGIEVTCDNTRIAQLVKGLFLETNAEGFQPRGTGFGHHCHYAARIGSPTEKYSQGDITDQAACNRLLE